MRRVVAALTCTALCATAAAPAAAEHRAGHRYCESAGAGPRTADGPWYRQLHTYNLSCRKGHVLMKAFARRHGTPPEQGAWTERIRDYRCKANFRWHYEGVVYGTVACRKGKHKVDWFGAGPGSPGGGGGGPG
jgi:hypothetical protein